MGEWGIALVFCSLACMTGWLAGVEGVVGVGVVRWVERLPS